MYGLLEKGSVKLQPVALKNGKKTDGCERNNRWKVIINETIEIDEL